MSKSFRPGFTATFGAFAPLLVAVVACAPASAPRDAGHAGAAADANGLVRGLHIARGAPPLSITYDGGQPMAQGVRFGGMTSDVGMPEGDHDFAINDGSGAALAHSDQLALNADARWSLVMWGDPTEMHASLLATPNASQHGYRVIHALAHNDHLHARLFGGNLDAPLDADLASGAVSPVAGAGSGDGPLLGVDTDGDGTDDATFTLTKIDASSGVTDLFVIASADGTSTSVMACTSSGLVEVPADGPVPPALIRALHLSPNAPAVDVFVDGAQAFGNLAFQGATAYASLAPQLIDIDVAPAGAGVGSSVLSVKSLELLSKKNYTAVAFGNLPNIRALALEDDFSPVSPGKIRVRAVHAADGVGTVDVLVVDPASNTSIATLYSGVDFGTATDYAEVDAQAVRLGLDVDHDGSADVTFDVPALPAGTVASIFAVATTTGVELVAATQDGAVVINAVPPAPPASVRVVHLSPDAPAVSVSANGTSITHSLAFENATDFTALSSSSAADLDIALASSPDQPILSVTGLDLAPGSFTTAVAFGRASDLRALALTEDRTPPAAGNIRVRPVHLAVGIGNVDIYEATPSGHVKIFDDVAFGTAGDAIEIPAGAYTIAFDLDHDAHPDLVFNLPYLPAGSIANLFAVTDAQGNASIAIEQ